MRCALCEKRIEPGELLLPVAVMGQAPQPGEIISYRAGDGVPESRRTPEWWPTGVHLKCLQEITSFVKQLSDTLNPHTTNDEEK